MEPVDMNPELLLAEVEKMKKTIERNCDAINNHIKHSVNQDLLIDQLHVDLKQARERINRLESIVFTIEQGNMKMGERLAEQYKDRIKAGQENA